MIVTAGHGEDLQGDITHDAPNTFSANGSLNGIVTRSYLRTCTIETNLGINFSPKIIDHTNINNTRVKTKSDSDALTNEEKVYDDVKEKENAKGEHRDLVSYKAVTTRCHTSLGFCP